MLKKTSSNLDSLTEKLTLFGNRGSYLGETAPKIMHSKAREPRPLCPPNICPHGISYTTIYNQKWSSVKEHTFKHHITINPSPDCKYIETDSVEEHLTYFKKQINILESKILYNRILGVYENDNKKLHFHLLVDTKEIKLFIKVLQEAYGGIRYSKYAVVNKIINLNSYNKNILKTMPLKLRKQLLNNQISYIRNTYMTKEFHNKENYFIYSKLKNL